MIAWLRTTPLAEAIHHSLGEAEFGRLINVLCCSHVETALKEIAGWRASVQEEPADRLVGERHEGRLRQPLLDQVFRVAREFELARDGRRENVLEKVVEAVVRNTTMCEDRCHIAVRRSQVVNPDKVGVLPEDFLEDLPHLGLRVRGQRAGNLLNAAPEIAAAVALIPCQTRKQAVM